VPGGRDHAGSSAESVTADLDGSGPSPAGRRGL